MANKHRVVEDIILYRDWSILFLECVINYSETNTNNDIEIFNEMIDIVNREAEKGNIRGLRLVVNDLLEWYSHYPENTKREMGRIFLDKLGKRYLTINSFRDKIVKSVLKSKKILSDEDYYAVNSFVHDSDVQQKHPQKISKLEIIMSSYQSEELPP